MRSAKQFATDFSSVWNEVTPTMEHFVRAVNAGFAQRRFPPLPHSVAADRRAFLNEVAFRWFASSRSPSGTRERAFEEAVKQARDLMQHITRETKGDTFSTVFNKAELWDMRLQARRLFVYFLREVRIWGNLAQFTIDPFVPGCGFVDSAYADVRIGPVLYEVKGGDRQFRSIDFRQILTYSALLFGRQIEIVNRISLCNPRTGMIFQCPLSILSQEVAGCTSEELLYSIREKMSSGDLSA